MRFRTGVFRLLLVLTLSVSIFFGVAWGIPQRDPITGFFTYFLPIFLAGLAVALLIRWVMSGFKPESPEESDKEDD
jgi:hypothetical protein